MITEFRGVTADEAWRKAADALTGQSAIAQASRCGDTDEILRGVVSIEEPVQRWVQSRGKPINLPFAIAETVWILRGRNDSAFLNYFNTRLAQYAGDGERYHGAYGYRIRRRETDQLERAFLALRGNPDTRQVVLQIWDSKIDFPDDDGGEVSPDVPCNIVSMLKVRGGTLEWAQIMRSNDVFRGLPYNIVQFTTLQEVLAGWLGVQMGGYCHFADSLHLYDRDRADLIAVNPTPSGRNLDSLRLPKPESDAAFAELEAAIEVIISDSAGVGDLLDIVRNSALDDGHRNLLCVITGEGIRRRQRPEEGLRLVAESCSNALFRSMFAAWTARFREDASIR